MERNQKHIDEGTLHAWLDGALSPEESARVEAHVASCAACRAAVAEARGVIAAASRILTALDDAPGGVAPGGTGGSGGRGADVRAAPPHVDAALSRRSTGSVGQSSAPPSSTSAQRRRRLWTGWPLRAAAAVLFVVAGSLAVVDRMGIEYRRGTLATPRTTVAPSKASAQNVDTESAPVAALQEPAKKQQPVRKRQVVAAAKAAPPTASQSVAPASVSPPAPAPAPAREADAVSAPVTYLDSAAAGPVTITGRVVSAKTGEPVPDATVQLSNPSNPPIRTATDATGGYAIQFSTAQASNQPAQLTVRRIGYESKIDSVTLARNTTPRDTVRHDIALAPSTLKLSEVVVTGAGKPAAAAKAASPSPAGVAQAKGNIAYRVRRFPTAPGCYSIDAAGLPARIELGEHLRVLPPDSAAFPTAYWMPVGRTAVRIVLTDTSGTTREIRATIASEGLQGSVTRSDSASVVKPFSASRTSTQCP